MIAIARRYSPRRTAWPLSHWANFARRCRSFRATYAQFLGTFPPLKHATLTDLTVLARPLEKLDAALREAEALARHQHGPTVEIAPPESDLTSPWSSPMGGRHPGAVDLDPDRWTQIATALRTSHAVAVDLRTELLETACLTGEPARRFGTLIDAIADAAARMQALAEKQHPEWDASDAFSLAANPRRTCAKMPVSSPRAGDFRRG